MSSIYEKLGDPGFFQENRIPAHSDHAADDKELRRCLNGSWRFYYAENFSGAPEGFEAMDFDDSQWDRIQVPGHIQLQGYDVPQYVNIQYPWDGREALEPGQIPEHFNPVASYITWFEIPEALSEKRIFLSFQGVESCFQLWVNGQYVGFASDTFTPSEFELTGYIQNGKNKLAVQVYKWYCGSN